MRALIKPEKLKIRAARKPQKHNCLSGVVWLTDDNGRRSCNIRFGEDAIDNLAKILPYGLGPAMPGFLKVIKKPLMYEVWFCYLELDRNVFLWSQDQYPSWCPSTK